MTDDKKSKPRHLPLRIVQSYWRLSRGLTMGAQGLILDDADNVMLIRHTYRSGWHFPGGGVEKNETVGSALVREVREEAGVRILNPPPLFGLYANFKAFPSDHVALFIVRDWEQPEKFAPTAEIAECRTFPADQLPEGTVSAVHRRLSEVLRDSPRSDIW